MPAMLQPCPSYPYSPRPGSSIMDPKNWRRENQKVCTGGVGTSIASNTPPAYSFHGVPIDPTDYRTSRPLFALWEDYVGTFLPRLDQLTFIQLGAHCGLNAARCASGGDPIWSYATRCSWSGVSMEAVLATFYELCQNYSPYPAVHPMRGAVARRSGIAQMMLVKGVHGSEMSHIHVDHMQSSEGSGSIPPTARNRTDQRGGALGPWQHTKSFGGWQRTPAVTLEEIWSAWRATHASSIDSATVGARQAAHDHTHVSLDILAIDIEGSEGEVSSAAARLPYLPVYTLSLPSSYSVADLPAIGLLLRFSLLA